MELQEIIAKALGTDLEAFMALNQKNALFIPLSKDEEKKFKEFRTKITEYKGKEEKAPRLVQFAEEAKKLQAEFGFKTSELIAALKGGAASTKTTTKVGVFKLADYKFKPKDKAGTEILGADKKPIESFEWEFGKQYGNSWQSKFIAEIVKGGLDKAQKHFTEDFKKWLAVERKKDRGDGTIKENARLFYKRFNLKEDGKTKIA